MSKFTFKKEPYPTGLASVCFTPSTCIRTKRGFSVGTIYPPSDFRAEKNWRICLALTDNEEKCGFKWITLKARFDTEPEARTWLNENYAKITERYDLYQMEDCE